MVECHVTTKVAVYEGVGKCIYCGIPESASKLSDEHIIPYALGGRMRFKHASCGGCAEQTSALEGNVLGTWFKICRQKLNIKSRRKKFRSVTLMEKTEDGEKPISVAVDQLPKSVLIISFSYPPILLGLPRDGFTSTLRLNAHIFKGDHDWFRALSNRQQISVTPGGMRFHDYVRMFAKIGHSFAVAELGWGTFDPLLTDYIRHGAENLDDMLYYIGGYLGQPTKGTMENDLHELSLVIIGDYIVVELRLFACLNMPVHTIVVGRRRLAQFEIV